MKTSMCSSSDPSSSEPNAFLAYAATWRPAIDSALVGGLAAVPNPELRAYLYRPALEFFARGGKRLRPALALLGCEVTGGSPECALPVAAAVEYFQAAALIHDDIADHATQRRGLPALHRTQGEGLAITIGDLALVESFLAVIETAELPLSTRQALLRELGAMMLATVEGQALDLGWARERRWDISPADYLTMAELKTAHYTVASPLVMGALVAGASQEVVDGLRAGGLKAGLAFQIVDDVLDLTASAETLGKEPYGDITEGKRTLVVALALERLAEPERTELVELLESTTHDHSAQERAVELLTTCKALSEATQKAQQLAQEALVILSAIELPLGPARTALLTLPTYIYERTA